MSHVTFSTPTAELTIHCGYCGADDQLPADELGRALELKRRVQKTAHAVAQLSGVQAALAFIFEDRGAFAMARQQRGQSDGRQHRNGEFVKTEARQHGHRYRLADWNCATLKMSAF